MGEGKAKMTDAQGLHQLAEVTGNFSGIVRSKASEAGDIEMLRNVAIFEQAFREAMSDMMERAKTPHLRKHRPYAPSRHAAS